MIRWSPTRMVPSMEAVGTTEASPTKVRRQKMMKATMISRPVERFQNDRRAGTALTITGAGRTVAATRAASATGGRSHNSGHSIGEVVHLFFAPARQLTIR